MRYVHGLAALPITQPYNLAKLTSAVLTLAGFANIGYDGPCVFGSLTPLNLKIIAD